MLHDRIESGDNEARSAEQLMNPGRGPYETLCSDMLSDCY